MREQVRIAACAASSAVNRFVLLINHNQRNTTVGTQAYFVSTLEAALQRADPVPFAPGRVEPILIIFFARKSCAV